MKTSDAVNIHNQIRSLNGGFFISRGEGIHPTRNLTSYEIIFVVRGVLDIWEEDRDYRIRAGESLILYPGYTHGGRVPYPRDLQFYWLHFNSYIKPGKEFMEIPKQVSSIDKDRIIQLFRWFLNDQEDGRGQDVRADFLVKHILLELSRTNGNKDEGPVPYILEQTREILNTRFNENISTGSISRELRCNSDYLGRIYHRYYGYTLTRDLQEIRIKHAKNQLMNTCDFISNIAYECGFNDPGYFRKVFKRCTGVTPKAYRDSFSRVTINTE
jgi:AraC-like DNA-binding protein